MSILKAAATSATLMSLGDVFAQRVLQGHEQIDWKRTQRFGLIGLCLHGPYFYLAYGLIDRLGGKDPKQWLRKTAVSHVTVFPVYICCFLSALTIVERIPQLASVKPNLEPLDTTIHQRIKDNAWTIFRDGTAFWPLVNYITFGVLPQGPGSQVVKVAWANVAGLLWQTYLSLSTNKIPNATHDIDKTGGM